MESARRTGREQELPAGTHVFALYHEHPAIDFSISARMAEQALRYVEDKRWTYHGMFRSGIPKDSIVVVVNLPFRPDSGYHPGQFVDTSLVDMAELAVASGAALFLADAAFPESADLGLILALQRRNLLPALRGYCATGMHAEPWSVLFDGSQTSSDAYGRLAEDCCYRSVVKGLTQALFPDQEHVEARVTMTKALLPAVAGHFLGDIPPGIVDAPSAGIPAHLSTPSRQMPRHATAEAPHTKEELQKDLESFGIPKDETILLHSSCRSIGPVSGGADTVLDVLQEYFRQGLLVLPTHTWDRINPENPVFHVADTACCTGILPELFRKRPDVFRSGHPTHSVAAYGADAAAYVADDIHCDTPCARNSSWGKLLDRDATIVLLGVTFTRNTFIHGIEEYLDIPGRLTDNHATYYSVGLDGKRTEVQSRRHVGHPSEHFDLIISDCIGKGIVRRGFFGDAPVLWCKARELAAEVSWRLFLEPHLFDDPDPSAKN